MRTIATRIYARAAPRSIALALALLVIVTAGDLAGRHARAQTPTPSPSASPEVGEVTTTLIRQPVWYGPQDSLGIRVRIQNASSAPVAGFQIVIGVGARVTNRSTLHSRFETGPDVITSSLPFFFDRTIPPQSSAVIDIDEPLSSFATFATTTSGGVYPATISLIDTTSSQTLSTEITSLIYYPQLPETRLNLALLLPLTTSPERLPDGTFTTENSELASAIDPGGWLSTYAEVLGVATDPIEVRRSGSRRGQRKKQEAAPPPDPVHLSIAPTPRMIEELQDMADGFVAGEQRFSSTSPEAGAAERFLGALAEILQKSEVQTVPGPYAFPDLPTLVEQLPIEHAAEQLATGKDILQEVVDPDLDDEWLFPPAGRLDARTLAEFQRLGQASTVFLSDPSVATPVDPAAVGCPQPSQTFTCIAEVRTIQDTSRALVADAGLTDIVAKLPTRPHDRATLQQFFAETSMIREELPGIPDRIVHVTIPSLWRPSKNLAKTLIEGLREAPWLTTVTAAEAIESAGETSDREIVESAAPIANTPDDSFFDAVEASADVVDSYGRVVPTSSQRIVRMKRNIMTALSRSWWRKAGGGGNYAEEARREAEAELGKISLAGPPTVTFTARRGELQLVVINSADYPVRVKLDFFSANLDLGSPNTTAVYPPGNQPITVKAIARTSGDFPIRVRLLTPDDRLIAETTIRIRSTSLNRVALTITVGALVFLILFYMGRSFRRKKRAAMEDSGG